jgi:hypothetical protein
LAEHSLKNVFFFIFLAIKEKYLMYLKKNQYQMKKKEILLLGIALFFQISFA